MSKHSAGMLGDMLSPGEQAGKKPYHPDASRWSLAFIMFFVFLLGLLGRRLLAFMERSSESFQLFLIERSTSVYTLVAYLEYAALGLIGMVLVLAMVGIPIRLWFWRRAMRSFGGTYLVVVLPRPEGTTGGSTNNNTDALFVFWDRLLAIVQRAKEKKSTAYLSFDLWGNSSGRVRWGVYLPSMMQSDRDAVRRLMTAERPQARLVEVPDPLEDALRLDPEDPRDTGVRFYASALLNLGARDCYPLPTDGLTLPTLVSTLRPRTGVMASGVSVIAAPETYLWAQRINQLAQRWLWLSRYRRKFDERWKTETDLISMKAQQTHARFCVRVQVIAKTREDAVAERDALVTTLVSSTKRYSFATQVLKVRGAYCLQLQAPAAPPQQPGRVLQALDRLGGRVGLRLVQDHVTRPVKQDIPLEFRVRAPFRPHLRALFVIPFFPFC